MHLLVFVLHLSFEMRERESEREREEGECFYDGKSYEADAQASPPS